VVLRSSRAVGVQKFAIWLLCGAVDGAGGAGRAEFSLSSSGLATPRGINGNLRLAADGTGTSIFCFRSTAR